MSVFRTETHLNEKQIHNVLRNDRRRRVLRQLQQSVGQISVRELSEAIAEEETGKSPPPRNIRDSVYNALNQTHLPKLDTLGILEYNQHRKTVSLQSSAREVSLYMEVVTKYGITWAKYYQLLMLVSLLAILAAEIGVPAISSVPTLLLCSLFLVVLGVSIVNQLWSRRWVYLHQLFS